MKNKKNQTNFFGYTLGTLAFAGMFLFSCSKDPCHPEKQTNNPSPEPPPVQTAEIQADYTKAKQANDSLVLYHDSLLICQSNNSLPHDSAFYVSMMSHCDSNYHTHDSLMNEHHNSMHGNSGMMDGGMMNGGSGMMVNNNRTGTHCTISDMPCQTAIDSLHSKHKIHHL